eukprot:CAMPEP_0174733754 /NCGR_PEP_ID=MMETSP1094-20130205/61962_1 /TAXON_ID=156173 /ORGANISM="Chrysochromulina brevifilum, Strain UTEX LB 985" /LENGTH=201 /DNA_ID=CAMNT_0015936455 /DNA_START=116 /DNA_END=721 /DNA_ORIENTATION=-
MIELLLVLSNQVTHGVIPKDTSAEGESESANTAGTISQSFRREVAELRRTLQVRSDANPDMAVTPRFSLMAQSVIWREEQLQRKREMLRSQRARNQADLQRVQTQIKAYDGPKDKVYEALKRMEDEHMQAAQRWEYKRECMREERRELLELTLQAFCKIVRVDHAPRHQSLIHNTNLNTDASGEMDITKNLLGANLGEQTS